MPAKLINFPVDPTTNTPEGFMNDVVKRVLDLEPEMIIVSVKCKDGSVATGYFNRSFGTLAELIGHLQVDLVDMMIRANIDRYLEEV